MTFTLIFATLVGISAGLVAWVIFSRIYDQLVYYRNVISEATATRFTELFLFVDLSRYIYLYVAGLVFLPLLTGFLSGHWSVGALTFLALLGSPYFILQHMVNRRLKKFEHQLPDALIMIAGSMRAGASLSIALDNLIRESPDPLRQEFSLLVRERKLGVDMDTALDNMEKRLPIEGLSMALSAVRISREVGGDLAGTLTGLAETLRRKITMEGKIDSLTAQGKMQGIVMSVLPLLLMVALMRLEPEAMAMMFTTKMGWAVLMILVCMQVMGYMAIKKITTIDV